MGRIQWPMSCLELTIVRLELPSNLLVAHAFVWRVLIYFVSHVIMFWQWQTGKYEQCPANIYSFTSNTRKSILFPETHAIARARAGTHVSKFTCAIYHTCEITVFSRKEKFFIERFSIEHN